jgi:hypothetical protein
MTGVEAGPFRVVTDYALEVVPRTLMQNAGGNTIRALMALRVRISPRRPSPLLLLLVFLALYFCSFF